MKLLLVGATGLVGNHVLKLALANDKISRVVVHNQKGKTKNRQCRF